MKPVADKIEDVVGHEVVVGTGRVVHLAGEPAETIVFADPGMYTVWERVFGKDGGFTTHQISIMVSGVLPPENPTVTVAEGQTAANSGKWLAAGTMELSASVGTIT